MPKIDPLPPEDWNPEQRELLAPMQNDEGVGEIAHNLFATLVRHPKLFKRWSVFANHVLFKSSLDAVLRELAILRIAWLTKADYEWGQHVLIAKKYGLPDTVIRRVKQGSEAEDWNPQERALLLAVDQLHEHCEIDDACWTALAGHLNEQQILDLIFTVGNYRLLAGFMNSTQIVRDKGVPGLDEP